MNLNSEGLSGLAQLHVFLLVLELYVSLVGGSDKFV